MFGTLLTNKGKIGKSKFFTKDKNNLVISDSDLTDIFANNFEKISSDSNLSPELLTNRTVTINEFLISHLKNKVDTNEITVDSNKINEDFKKIELIEVPKKLNLNSSPGCDDIPFSLFIQSPDNVLNFLLNIINFSWKTNS